MFTTHCSNTIGLLRDTSAKVTIFLKKKPQKYLISLNQFCCIVFETAAVILSDMVLNERKIRTGPYCSIKVVLLYRTASMGARPSQNPPATARLESWRCTTVTATPLQCLGRHNTSTDQVRFRQKIKIKMMVDVMLTRHKSPPSPLPFSSTVHSLLLL